jgi:hypothetical protein
MNTRRQFLRGMASLVALPSLESVAAAPAASTPPLRLAYIYAPNGVNTALWFPRETGAAYALPPSLEPLAPLRESFQVVSGLSLDKARPNGDGAGDHARANAAFLTGCQPRKTAGADIRNGISVDQIAAAAVGHETRLPSLEISTDDARRSGNCDSGYSCAYQFNLAWRSETTPVPAQRDPRRVFERLFGTGDREQDARRVARRKSVLDFVMEDARRLQARASGADRVRLDEYFTSVREIESRIGRAEGFRREVPEFDVPNGVPEGYREHLRLMYDMLALAFATDSTRVATYLLAHDGSNRTFPEIGIRDPHHGLSHHQKNPRNLEALAKIDHFYISEFARFLGKLRDTREHDGSSLLEHCMIVHGGGIHDGDRHNHDDLPILLAGGGGGTLQPGRHIRAVEGTPLTNLHLALLKRMGAPADRVGDSTGVFGV